MEIPLRKRQLELIGQRKLDELHETFKQEYARLVFLVIPAFRKKHGRGQDAREEIQKAIEDVSKKEKNQTLKKEKIKWLTNLISKHV